MSNAAMSKLLDGLAPGYTVHGFRSTFRDWVAEETEHSGDVAEMALAHKIASSVEASYRRGNLMARRRRLMEDWESYCSTPDTGNVINFERIAA
jgi:integrase